MYACTHSEDYKNYILMRGRLREKRVRHKQKEKKIRKQEGKCIGAAMATTRVCAKNVPVRFICTC
jgi:hypothetical protein